MTLCNSMDFRAPGFAVLYYLPESAQKSGPLNWYCHLIILSSVTPFPSCLQPFPASGSFPIWTSCGQSMATSASVFPTNIQGWFSVGLTGLIFLLSKGLSRVFSSTTVQKCYFFGAQSSLWSNSNMGLACHVLVIISSIFIIIIERCRI